MKTLVDLSKIENIIDTNIHPYNTSRFMVEFNKGLDIDVTRVFKFKYDRYRNKFEFSMSLYISEDPDMVVDELLNHKEKIIFTIHYLDITGVSVWKKTFHDYYLSSASWDMEGDRQSDGQLEIKFNLLK